MTPRSSTDRIEPLSTSERWVADARAVTEPGGGFMERTVEMTRASSWLDGLRVARLPGTVAHLVVRAAAIALARNPALHQIVCGYDRLIPGAVDIGVTMPGPASFVPVVIRAVDQRSLQELIPAMDGAIASAHQAEERSLASLRRLGWLAPFGFLRRFVLRWLQGRFWFRRRAAGTFQVTIAPMADLVVAMRFYAGSSLGVGRLRDVVVTVEGRVEVRQMMTLTLAANHVALDGLHASMLLNAIAAVLEGEELGREALPQRLAS